MRLYVYPSVCAYMLVVSVCLPVCMCTVCSVCLCECCMCEREFASPSRSPACPPCVYAYPRVCMRLYAVRACVCVCIYVYYMCCVCVHACVCLCIGVYVVCVCAVMRFAVMYCFQYVCMVTYLFLCVYTCLPLTLGLTLPCVRVPVCV